MNLKNQLRKIKSLPTLTEDRQVFMMGKHQLLSELNRRHERPNTMQLNAGEVMRLTLLRVERKLIPRRQFAISLLVLLVVSTSTGVMAQTAVPGDFLWPVKLSMEKAELALAVDSAQEGRLHLKHAESRLQELIVVVAQKDDQSRSQNISQIVRRLEKDITAASQSLKVTREEKQDSQPQVVLDLAQDVSTKATEVVKALEENKKALSDSSANVLGDSLATITGVTTSTPPLTGSPDITQGTSTTTAEQEKTIIEAKVVPSPDLKQVITEVQLVNDYISYAALNAMINVVEHRDGTNRSIATQLLNDRIAEQKSKYETVQSALPLINDNFILHRNKVRVLLKSAEEALKQADSMVTLDNLSAGLRQLTDAKNFVSDAARILQEVEAGNGLKKDSDVVADQSKPITKRLTIQSMPNEQATSSDTELEYVENKFRLSQ